MCGTMGALVSSKTVEHLIKDEIKVGLFNIEIFSLCIDKICEMAYYTADYGYLYLTRDISVPLDYKEDVSTKYICYCNKITEKEVRDIVLNNGYRTVKEVMSNRGKIITEECTISNPFGYCCLPDIKRFIEEVITETSD